MEANFNIKHDQLTFKKLLLYHFYPGISIALFYILVSPWLIGQGIPGLGVLLMAEVLVLAPIGLAHLGYKSFQLNDNLSLRHVVYFTEALNWKQYLKWTAIGIGGCVLIYLPLYPVGLFLREHVFFWLPAWYFDPGFGSENTEVLAKVFLVGIFVDGLVGPIVEELFFRGYLLPRMSYLKKWAPGVNGLLFGLYHLWQPHNYLAIIGVGMVISYVVWKKQNVYLGIFIHCILNIIGAVAGYHAASNGVIIGR